MERNGRNGHWARASASFKLGKKELERARRRRDKLLLSDACAKGWLSVVEAENALLRSKGLSDKGLPRNYRGQMYLLQKHTDKETAKMFAKLWTALHVAGYYWGEMEFSAAEAVFEDLESFLKRIESSLNR